MRRIVFFILSALFASVVSAQNVREELKQNMFKAGSNYYAYPDPQTKLTPAPKGMKPFYISTYARHGSRFLIKGREYEQPYQLMLKASKHG